MDSIGLSLVLVLSGGALGAKWYTTQTALNALAAPALSGFSWSDHPNAVLIAVPAGDCGCGSSPGEIARQAISRRLDVVVIVAREAKEVSSVERVGLPTGKIRIYRDAEASVVKRFCPGREVGVALVRDGLVVGKTTGHLPSNFLKEAV